MGNMVVGLREAGSAVILQQGPKDPKLCEGEQQLLSGLTLAARSLGLQTSTACATFEMMGLSG